MKIITLQSIVRCENKSNKERYYEPSYTRKKSEYISRDTGNVKYIKQHGPNHLI